MYEWEYLFVLRHSNPVDFHCGFGPLFGLSDGHRSAHTVEELAADGDVEYKVEVLIERRAVVVVRVGSLSGPHIFVNVLRVIGFAVESPGDIRFAPFNTICMEGGAQIDAKIVFTTTAVDVIWPCTSIVNCAQRICRPLTSVFHYINLTAGSPVSINYINVNKNKY